MKLLTPENVIAEKELGLLKESAQKGNPYSTQEEQPVPVAARSKA